MGVWARRALVANGLTQSGRAIEITAPTVIAVGHHCLCATQDAPAEARFVNVAWGRRRGGDEQAASGQGATWVSLLVTEKKLCTVSSSVPLQ